MQLAGERGIISILVYPTGLSTALISPFFFSTCITRGLTKSATWKRNGGMDFSNFPPLVFSFITGCDDEVELESRRQCVCTHTHTQMHQRTYALAHKERERKREEMMEKGLLCHVVCCCRRCGSKEAKGSFFSFIFSVLLFISIVHSDALPLFFYSTVCIDIREEKKKLGIRREIYG